MKRLGIEKIICIILICIILVEGIYIFLNSQSSDRPRNICSMAYACKCGENNELEMCDCKYCEDYDWDSDKCLKENFVQCSNPNVGDNNE